MSYMKAQPETTGTIIERMYEGGTLTDTNPISCTYIIISLFNIMKEENNQIAICSIQDQMGLSEIIFKRRKSTSGKWLNWIEYDTTNNDPDCVFKYEFCGAV